MKLIYGLELPTKHKLLYLVREGRGGGGGKNKDGGLPYEMKGAVRKTRSCHDFSVFW